MLAGDGYDAGGSILEPGLFPYRVSGVEQLDLDADVGGTCGRCWERGRGSGNRTISVPLRSCLAEATERVYEACKCGWSFGAA